MKKRSVPSAQTADEVPADLIAAFFEALVIVQEPYPEDGGEYAKWRWEDALRRSMYAILKYQGKKRDYKDWYGRQRTSRVRGISDYCCYVCGEYINTHGSTLTLDVLFKHGRVHTKYFSKFLAKEGT